MNGTDDPGPNATMDFAAPADLYFPAAMGRRGGIGYRRFSTAETALSYAFATLSGPALAAAALEVDGVRYSAIDMRRLHDLLQRRDETSTS